MMTGHKGKVSNTPNATNGTGPLQKKERGLLTGRFMTRRTPIGGLMKFVTPSKSYKD